MSHNYREEGEFWGLTFRSIVMFSLGLLVLAAIAGGGRYVYLKTWGVKTADAERAVFEESKSYQHGTIRDLENLRVEYGRADSEAERAILRETILHRLAAFDDADLPDHLRSFVKELRTNEEGADE